MNQMRAEAALTVMRALRVRTVACREIHGSLLMKTVCHPSGVYSERSRLSLVHIHPRYRGTPPNFREGAGNVDYGRTRTPLRNRKSGDRKLPTYGCARLCSTRTYHEVSAFDR